MSRVIGRLAPRLFLTLALAALALGLVAMTTFLSSGTAHALTQAGNNCSGTAIGPVIVGHSRDITKLSVASTGKFRCSRGLNRAVLKVELQGRSHGHWTKLAEAHKTLDMRAGKPYTLRAKLACRANAPKRSFRTHVALNGLHGTSPSSSFLCA